MTSSKLRTICVSLGALFLLFLNACSDGTNGPEKKGSTNNDSICIAKSGKPGRLGPHKVCVFEDNRQCSFEAISEQRCIEHGYKITGYENELQAYCAVSGYEADLNELVCRVSADQACSFEAFFTEKCP